MNPTTAKTWHSPWPAPAKLNLFLHVLGRRPDGYHDLQTVFQLIEFYDWLSFRPRKDKKIILTTPLAGVAHEDNLVVRAARLLQQHTGCNYGVEITLEKNIPSGGGLGGGSSDAATTLLALNHLWQLNIDRIELQKIALTLGADVPVFVYGQNTFASGIGEQFFPVQLPTRYYLIIIPPVQIPTKMIFADSDLNRSTPAIDPASWQILSKTHNDLEPIAAKHFPVIAKALTALNQYAPAHMTGSGACLFASFDHQDKAKQASQQLGTQWQCMVFAGLSTHPLAAVSSRQGQ